LYESGKQMIITSDRNPSDMAALTDRLQHRFGSGVMVKIDAPDQETRLQVIRLKAEKYGLRLSAASMEYIAAAVENIRSAEGVLKKLCAYRDLTCTPVTDQLVQRTVDSLPTARVAPQITPQMILQLVCTYYNTDQTSILSADRSRNIAEPRQLSMYLARTLTALTLDDIAALFSRDRATVIYSIKKTEQALRQKDSHLHAVIEEIRNKLSNT
jgi:chromosomal replication initiator protein